MMRKSLLLDAVGDAIAGVLLLAWLLFAASAAHAQNAWTTPGGSVVNGAVGMCLNGSGQAVPCNDATAVASPVTVANGADVTEGAIADAAVTTNASGTLSAKLRGIVAILADVWDSTNHWLKVGYASQYPNGATPLTATATGTTAATTATLAGTSGKTTYLCGFSIRANATAAATGNATVTGTITGTLIFTQWTAPLASGIGVTEPSIGAACIPASAANTGIAVVSAAPGNGGTVSVSAWGYQL